jgi:hypothetical protein
MKKSNKTLKILACILFVVVIAGNVYFYLLYKNARDSDPNVQTEQIVSSLKRTVDVPNETPSVLTVVDKSKLKDSQIAQKSENGDKILLFQKAGQVYIYRPSTDKLINILSIAPSNQAATQATPTENQTQTQPESQNTQTNQSSTTNTNR